MTHVTAELPRDRPGVMRSVLLVLLLLGLVGVAVAGLRTGVELVANRSEHAAVVALAAPTRDDLTLGQHVRTSFGALTADAAQVNNGLSSEELGGMSHGVSALVKAGRAQVEVILTLSNARSRPVLVAADQFRLVTRRGSAAPRPALRPSGTTLTAGPLPAGASIDTRVSFVVPTDGAMMTLLYQDPGLAAPVRIALGRTDLILSRPDHAH